MRAKDGVNSAKILAAGGVLAALGAGAASPGFDSLSIPSALLVAGVGVVAGLRAYNIGLKASYELQHAKDAAKGVVRKLERSCGYSLGDGILPMAVSMSAHALAAEYLSPSLAGLVTGATVGVAVAVINTDAKRQLKQQDEREKACKPNFERSPSEASAAVEGLREDVTILQDRLGAIQEKAPRRAGP